MNEVYAAGAIAAWSWAVFACAVWIGVAEDAGGPQGLDPNGSDGNRDLHPHGERGRYR